MNLKILIYGIFFMIISQSCNNQITDQEILTPQNSGIKSASIGTNYFVSKTGNDSNAGTTESPFLTIQKAANMVNPGDTVIVKDGTYTNTTEVFININRSGTTDNYIVFKSEHKWGAVLDGLEVDLTNGSGYAFDINSGASYIKIQDFEIKNFIHAAVISNDQILTSSYIVVQGNKIHDNGRFNNTVEEAGAVGIYAREKSHHWTINANLIYNIGRTGPDNLWLNKDHAIYTGQTASTADAAHHFTITNNIMFGCSGVAVVLCGTNDLVANNVMAWSNENHGDLTNPTVLSGSPLMACQIYVTDLVVANNVFFQPPALSYNFAISNIGNIVRWTVKNNMVYGGSMWQSVTAERKAAMAGANYGQNDCEYPEVNPLFVSALKANAPNVDFRLQASSPAINAGVDQGIKTDYLNNVKVGLPDIGAYEYAGTASPLPVAPVVPATIYYNTTISGTATKNDCGTGYTGSNVTYTVLARKFSSVISQLDADNKALSDLNTNKQSYANANGTCTAVTSTVYYNTEVSASITKKSCGTGYVGSLVTYTVSSGKYSSTVSQVDADNKALADLTNNKQAYANANGTCTPLKIRNKRR